MSNDVWDSKKLKNELRAGYHSSLVKNTFRPERAESEAKAGPALSKKTAVLFRPELFS